MAAFCISNCFRETNLLYLSKACESIRKKISQQTYFTPRKETQDDCVHHVHCTCFDMTERNWIPSHFVPALPIDISQKTEYQDIFDLKIQRWRLMRERKLAKDELKKLKLKMKLCILMMTKKFRTEQMR